MRNRPTEIVTMFNALIDQNLNDLMSGKSETYLDIHQAAEQMHIHAIHLSNTIKEVTGKAPCDICNEKTIALVKVLLANTNTSIAGIAAQLTFEPTNFTKYFKKHTGITPSAYRLNLQHQNT